MATLEAVTSELRVLNQNVELNFEANLEINDNISVLNSGINQLTDVMKSFVETVPASVMKGFDALLDFEKIQAKERKREEEVSQQKESGTGDDKPTTLKGAFMEGFEKDPVGDFFGDIKKSIFSVITTVGSIAKIITTGFSFIMTGITSLASVFSSLFAAISLPMVLVAAAITAIVSGIFGFVEDFQSQEGSLFDKIIAGIGGFIDGFLKILTIPLDWIKSLVSTILGFFGFDGAEKVLDSFSFTDMLDGFTDALVEFIIGLKDSIIEGLKGVGKSILGFFGFGDDDEEEVSTKRGKEIPSGTEGAELSERGQAAVDELKGDGAPEVDPKTGRRGRSIGTKQTKKVGGVVVEEDGVAREDFSEAELKKINAARSAAVAMGNEDPFPQLSQEKKVTAERKEAPAVPTKVIEAEKEQQIIQEIKSGKTAGEAIQAVSPSPVKLSPADFVKQQQEQFKKDIASGKVKPSTSEEPEPPKPVKVKKIADDFFKEQELNERVGALQAEQSGLIAQKESVIQSMLAQGMRVPADSRDPDYPFHEIDERLAEVRAKLKEARAELDKFEESQGPDPFDAALEGDSGFDALLDGDSGFDAALEGSDDFYDEKPMKLKGDSAGNVTTKVTTKVTESGGGSVTRRAAKQVDTEESKALSAEADAMQAALDEKLAGMDDMDAFDYLTTDEGQAEQMAIKQKRVAANAAKLSVAQSDIVEPAQERVALSESMQRETTKMQDGKAAESKSSAPVAINAPNTNTTVNNQTINAGPMPSATDKSDRTDRRAAFRGRAI